MVRATPSFWPLMRHGAGAGYSCLYSSYSPASGVAPTTVIPGGKAIEPARRSALGQRNQAGQQQLSMGIENGRVLGAESVRGSGPGVRSPWQSLGRCRRSAVHSVGQGMDRFGEFRVATHAVAVASDVDDVAPVEQAVGQLGGQDREAKDQPPSGDVSVGHATRQIPSIP